VEEVDGVRTIYIDPAYSAYYEDRLFDENHSALNRDGTLEPFIRMRSAFTGQGASVHTADRLFITRRVHDEPADYYSLGVLENYSALAARPDIRLRALVVLEPPVVAPHLYRDLPALTAAFDRVYVHNTEGDGYSLDGVNRGRLRKLFWPQPRSDVLDDLWSHGDRLRSVVVVNGNHKPASFAGELYSKRIEVMAELANLDAVDLFGRGWECWWSRNSMWWPYWRHRSSLMSIYKGACVSKFIVLSQYDFALCFENMAMKGYVTEKIFDCLYAGTIPIYLGAPDIAELIPDTCYVDFRNYRSVHELWRYLEGLSASEIDRMRAAGRGFIQSVEYLKYYDFLQNVITD
jgi:hypothetical protein